jgi:hypothetical protein
MNWNGCRRKHLWPHLTMYPGICLEGLRKTTKNVHQYSWPPGRDLKLGPIVYEAGVLPTKI